ncbi:MAG: hypothetical protein CO098_02230 [Bacteroidetes bacterium CG_4_9_14_3_um_filter_41_19]|nr:MAG: hypothetical protein CO098_02230 [Bacteroidetes bacterium CG_4_9_14_3_um_filter_41_19]
MDDSKTDSDRDMNMVKPYKPLMLRLTGISSMVMGAIGSLFFGSVIFYLLTDDEFSQRFLLTYYNIATFWYYLAIGLFLHLLLLASGLLLFKLKKAGFWTFLIAAPGLLLFAKVIDKNLFLAEILIVFFLFMMVLIYRKRLN